MSDNTIPEYLQPALAQLEKARAAHLENARLMDETVTAIERAEQEKNALAQADGNDADDWRTAFRAAGGVLSDELKQRHIERVARRELVQEYDNLAVVLNFERERLKGACDSTASRPLTRVRITKQHGCNAKMSWQRPNRNICGFCQEKAETSVAWTNYAILSKSENGR